MDMKDLDERLLNAQQQFDELYRSVWSRAGGDQTSKTAILVSLEKLHLSRELQETIVQAVEDEKKELAAEFLKQKTQKGKSLTRPPPPPPPNPPNSTPRPTPTPSPHIEEEQSKIIPCLSTEAKTSLLNKEKEIKRLSIEVEQQHEALTESILWRETTSQYSLILINAIQSLVSRLDDAAVRQTEKDCITRLCSTLAAHIGHDGTLGTLPSQVRTEVRRRSTISAMCFDPAAFARQFATSSDLDDVSQTGAALDARMAEPPPFLVLGECGENAAERVFSLYLKVQSEHRTIKHGDAERDSSAHYITRKTFLLLAFVLGVVDEKMSMVGVNTAFDRAALAAQRSQSKFNARLELNDFINAMSIVAAMKLAPRSASTSTGGEQSFGNGKQLSTLMSSLLSETETLLVNHVLRQRWVSTFSPLVDTSVYSKLAQYHHVLLSCYTRTRSYGLFTADTSASSSANSVINSTAPTQMSRHINAESAASRTITGTISPSKRKVVERKVRRVLEIAGQTALTSSRIDSNARTSRSPSRSPQRSPSPIPSPPPLPRPAFKVSIFETFCVNYCIIPNVTKASIPRRIAQYLRYLEAHENFRCFLAGIAYLALALSTDGSSLDINRDRFSETIDKILACVDLWSLRAGPSEGRV